ncbi:hypothetical protein B0T21DRAFT_343886 [Apiosordaria backusii]|uniref:Uncharacterized protein n=1 Tax=Apiosordaria backusii TaxID=314023 RepID=A0AA40EZ49_9PEZI|nr:hypothetical protein B0T21DRAFT_343886 [Apiosordaria backusii]
MIWLAGTTIELVGGRLGWCGRVAQMSSSGNGTKESGKAKKSLAKTWVGLEDGKWAETAVGIGPRRSGDWGEELCSAPRRPVGLVRPGERVRQQRTQASLRAPTSRERLAKGGEKVFRSCKTCSGAVRASPLQVAGGARYTRASGNMHFL